jgi:hypothetical protein
MALELATLSRIGPFTFRLVPNTAKPVATRAHWSPRSERCQRCSIIRKRTTILLPRGEGLETIGQAKFSSAKWHVPPMELTTTMIMMPMEMSGELHRPVMFL